MATTIVTKSGSGAPAASDLVAGELAVDLTNKRLYTEDSGGTVLELGTNPSGNVTFADNGKAIFGAGSDLEIYSDGSISRLDSTSASLAIKAPQFIVQDAGGTKNMVWVPQNGGAYEVQLSHDGSTKLTTTSTGIDITGNATFADNDKAIFGAGSDLQIYHDGSHSYVSEQGTGNLRIYANDLVLANNDGSQTFLYGQNGGPVSLSYANNAKLATTATGIDVTGSVTADGEIVGNNGTYGTKLTYSNGNQSGIIDTFGNHNLEFRANNERAMNIASNGDISFYEDTGSTPKFFWDASAESLGIGTSSPTSAYTQPALHIHATGNGAELHLTDGTTGATATDGMSIFQYGLDSYIRNREAGDIRFYSSNTERMRLDLSGNVGIGTSSPLQALHVSSGTGNSAAIFESTDSTSQIWLKDSASSTTYQTGLGCFGDNLLFNNGGERMRIDSSGNVGIGTSTPASIVGGTSTSAVLTVGGGDGSLVTGDRAGSISFKSDDASYKNTFSDGITGEIASVCESSVGSAYGMSFYTGTVNAVNRAERLRIDSTGNVGIGDSSPSSITSSVSTLSLNGTDAGTSGGLVYKVNGTIKGYHYVSSDFLLHQAVSGVGHRFLASNAEAMRIDSSGNLLVGCTSAAYLTADSGVQLYGYGGARFGADGTSARNIISFVNGTDGTPAEVGAIQTNGSSTSYLTSSDQRLKENIADADDAGSKIDSIQVRKYDWKADGQHQDYGMVAQELIKVAPEAVSAPEDPEDMMGVDYSKLVPMMLKEIQSLRARVAQLES